MSLSFYLAQEYYNKHLNRPIAIDGSLMGMGRIPGNLPIELISDYINDNSNHSYDIDYMMDAIQDYIEPLKGKTKWGYTPAYFLSARYNLHRDYAEHYLAKENLTNRDINHILSKFDRNKCTVYDPEYADKLYHEYLNNSVDDSSDRSRIKEKLKNRNILVIAPGKSIVEQKEQISKYIEAYNPLIFTVNFYTDFYKADYAFFSNNKRFDNIENKLPCSIIATSNLKGYNIDYMINFESLCGTSEEENNSLIMLLKLFKDLDVTHLSLAGADGYHDDQKDYYASDIVSRRLHGEKFNFFIKNAIKKTGLKVKFITKSLYE